MCLFPLSNNNFNGLAYKKGVTEFDCGACPECLRKRSNVWALRAVYESRVHVSNLMITLTYDKFKYDDHISNEELPPDPSIVVDKTHIQKFIKRLRKYISTHPDSGCDNRIKYICCAEYGSRTHRAHYHLILFGVDFKDKHFYKKSKRGNPIYMSQVLTDLWSYGICTIDSICVRASIARYCTKYCAKTRSDNTFMLCSQGIGLSELLKDFNGKSYFVDGREYPIPRSVWQSYIFEKYSKFKSLISFKYVNHNPLLKDDPLADDSLYYKSCADRKRYRYLRDRDPLYVSYLDYWRDRGQSFQQKLLSPLTRIYLLDDSKFHNYKVAALDVYYRRKMFVPYPAPGSNCVSSYNIYKSKLPTPGIFGWLYRINFLSPCLFPSRLNRASDTKLPYWIKENLKMPSKVLTKTYYQCNIFDEE